MEALFVLLGIGWLFPVIAPILEVLLGLFR